MQSPINKSLTFDSDKKKKNIFVRFFSIREMGTLIPLIAVILFTSLMNPLFLNKINLLTILNLLVIYAIVAAGESMVIIAGEIDISVGQTAALSAMVCYYLMVNFNLNPLLGVVIGLLVGAVIGLVNGLIVAKLKLSAFITTIGMYFIARGLKYEITGGYPIFPLPKVMSDFGNTKFLGLSYPFFIAVVLFIFLEFVLKKTVYGRHVYAVGSDKKVSGLFRINVTFIKVSTYVICGVCAALAGILIGAQLGVAAPLMGDGWELQVIAGAAVGGIALGGGAGSMAGTALGIIFIAVLNNALLMLHVDSNFQVVSIGLVLIAAVTFDTIKYNRKIRG
ncbi:MAG: ABC transporter permease [Candidatus Humimicrobiaceae bacterium]